MLVIVAPAPAISDGITLNNGCGSGLEDGGIIVGGEGNGGHGEQQNDGTDQDFFMDGAKLR